MSFLRRRKFEEQSLLELQSGPLTKELSNFSMHGILSNWKACMVCGLTKERRSTFWSPPSMGMLKFNVDGAARGKPGPAGIGGVLCDDKGVILCLFSKSVGVRDSNEAEVLAILEALRILSSSFQGCLIVESDSSNGISWVARSMVKPWKFQIFLNGIKGLASSLSVVFSHVIRSANGLVDSLAKQGVQRSSPWEVILV
eukprot:TRINITY_DN21101_c0_g1_i1.p1 TRINITY_DN21101_c0_g1~~TRINITY_DN21101_c0_g1_i1.p1  ORF type:complete len:199 (+),score=31.91 TRINITY_DN21101_c0_g1_i1:157-753(+)